MEKKTFDFSKVEILSLDGKKMGTEQLRAEVCNTLYMGKEIEQFELGQRLWHAIDENGVPQPCEISEKEEKILRTQFENYPYVVRQALYKELNAE